MAIEHSTIVDGERHEPIGIDSAAAGQVYAADGGGSGSWSNVAPSNTVVVNSEADFPTAAGGVITLADNTCYMLGAAITTANRFQLGSGTEVMGLSYSATLTYTGSGNMFTAATAGSFLLNNARFSCPSASFISGSPTVAGVDQANLRDIFVENCTSLGSLGNYQSIVFRTVGALNCIDGLTVTGTNLLFDWFQVGLVTPGTAAFTGLDFGTSVNTVISIDKYQAFATATGGIGITGAAAGGNLASGSVGEVANSNFINTTALSVISEDDEEWKFINNNGIPDTNPEAFVTMNGNSTATTISVAGTPVKVAGTFTEQSSSHFTTDATGRITYTGLSDLSVIVDVVLSSQIGSGTDDASVLVALNGTAIANSAQQQELTAGDPRTMITIWEFTLSTNDYVEVFIQNDDTTANITVVDAKFRIH